VFSCKYIFGLLLVPLIVADCPDEAMVHIRTGCLTYLTDFGTGSYAPDSGGAFKPIARISHEHCVKFGSHQQLIEGTVF
jgi:hypothetical protein